MVEPRRQSPHITKMDGDDIARLVYLSVLAVAVGGYFLVSGRQALTKSFRDFVLWGLIFIGIVAGYGLWSDVQDEVYPQQSYIQGTGEITVPQNPDGHYYLTLKIDGTPVRFVVDTGASEMVLSLDDARRVGIDVDGLAFLGSANTANGRVNTASVQLREVKLGPISDLGFRAAVNGGEMVGSLLGMEYLNRFSSLEIRDGVLVLTR